MVISWLRLPDYSRSQPRRNRALKSLELRFGVRKVEAEKDPVRGSRHCDRSDVDVYGGVAACEHALVNLAGDFGPLIKV